jgi:transmembrane protein
VQLLGGVTMDALGDTPRWIALLLTQPALTTAALVLLTLPYWLSGVSKLRNVPAALDEARQLHLHPSGLVVAVTIVVQLGMPVLIITGVQVWLAAGVLGGFTAMATLLAHRFWADTDPAARFQDRNAFWEHAGLIGGLMLAAILAEKPGFE